MNKPSLPVWLLLSSLSLSCGCTTSLSQETTSLSKEPFYALQQTRDKTLDAIRAKEADINVIKTNIEWRALEQQRKLDLARAQTDKKSPAELEQLKTSVQEATNNAGYPKTDQQLKDDLQNGTHELQDLKKLASDVEFEMNSRADVENPKQQFRTNMSITFAILVGLVIVGFYTLAYLDEKVRTEVFSRQSGIQFITLFSLVIAIILFGITGVLESKELSALLGGLSGYILGRSAGRSTSQPLVGGDGSKS